MRRPDSILNLLLERETEKIHLSKILVTFELLGLLRREWVVATANILIN